MSWRRGTWRRMTRRLTPTRAGIAVIVVIVAAIWGAAWQRSEREIAQAIEAANHANSNLAIAYEENAANALGDVDQTLALLEIEWREEGAAAARAIGQWPLERGFVRGLAVLDGDGTAAIQTGEAPTAPTRLREAFEFHRANSGRVLRIMAPREASSGTDYVPRVVLSRRIENADGSFAGVALALVDPAYFTRFYARADLGSDGLVSLVGRDLIALARRTGLTNTYANDMHGSTLISLLPAHPTGNFLSVGYREGTHRFISYRAMTAYPIVVMVGTSVERTLAPARERIRLYRIVASILSVLAALGAAAAMAFLSRQRRDFRALSETQARLRESIARQDAITDNMAGGVVITSADGTIVSVNRAACAMHGYEPGQLNGLKLSRLLDESARGFLAKDLERLSSPEPFENGSAEFLALRRDGSTFEAEVLFSAVTLTGRRSLVGIVHDIGVRKSLERSVRRSEALFRATFDQALVGILHTDLEGRFIRANQRACDMLGYTEEELLALGYTDVTHPEDLAASAARHAALVADPGQPFEFQVMRRYLRHDGSILWALASVNMIRGEHGQPDFFLTMVQDLTELKRVERMKSEFVSTVSHELRSPLTSIRGSLGLLAGGAAGALPPEARDLVLIGERNCERLIRLVNDILDTEKMDSGGMRFDLHVTDLRPLVDRAIESMEGYATAHRVVLRVARPPQALLANVDEDRFVQLLTNLLSNAIKFSPENGNVEVALAREPGDRLRLEVADHGAGMPEEFRDRIFQRFSQADSSSSRRHGGTGLGLYIAKGIVDNFGGTLDYRTGAAGTTFELLLPEAREPAAAPELARTA
jgi:PAS domain S-box-containing protein